MHQKATYKYRKLLPIIAVMIGYFSATLFTSCRTHSNRKNSNYETDVTKILEKEAKKKEKELKKQKKIAEKTFWKKQSKAVRKSIKKNNKRQAAKKRRKF
jgi:gas vesicle protein